MGKLGLKIVGRPFNAKFGGLSQTSLALEKGNDMIRFIFQEEKGESVEVG